RDGPLGGSFEPARRGACRRRPSRPHRRRVDLAPVPTRFLRSLRTVFPKSSRLFSFTEWGVPPFPSTSLLLPAPRIGARLASVQWSVGARSALRWRGALTAARFDGASRVPTKGGSCPGSSAVTRGVNL